MPEQFFNDKPNIENKIKSFNTGGQPLPESTRAFFEPRFGVDFSKVRVHTNPQAGDTAKNINSHAFTMGRNIVFGQGQYAPERIIGKKLLAHELSHVLQQRNNVVSRAVAIEYPTIKEKLSYGIFDWAITDEDAHDVLDILAGQNATNLAETVNQMKADGLLGRLLDNISDTDRSAFNALFVTLWNAHVPSHPSLAGKADVLGNDTITMNSYQKYQNKTWKWFFSPTNTLDGRASKPGQFNNWDDWNTMHWQSKQVIADLARLDASRLAQTNSNLTRLRAAYTNWPNSKFAIFQSGTSATNTCNVFLGNSLFMDGKNQTKGGKFYSAEEVYDKSGRFTQIPEEALSRGDIAAWGGHVEIVTAVNQTNN